MAKEDYASAGFFRGRKDAIMVGIEKAENRFEGLLAPPIFEHSHVSVFGNGGADALGQLDRAVMKIVMCDEAADETDDYFGRRGGGRGTDGSAFNGARDSR